MARPLRSPRARAAQALALAAAAALAALVGPPARGEAAERASLPPERQLEEARRCAAALERAAAREGVPLRLMRAVALVETGTTIRFPDRLVRTPWPWSVNADGEGRLFASRAAAERFAAARQAAGARAIDAGCMQINHRWHGRHFDSLAAMFDPEANAAYAARFLRSLYEETGDWMRAAGYYHSRTEAHFSRYAAKLRDVYAALSGGAEAAFAAEPRLRALARLNAGEA
ncbi:MAG: lytic transglycosylase domain-containing protein, partial [Pseudomonadota bacterium]